MYRRLESSFILVLSLTAVLGFAYLTGLVKPEAQPMEAYQALAVFAILSVLDELIRIRLLLESVFVFQPPDESQPTSKTPKVTITPLGYTSGGYSPMPGNGPLGPPPKER